MSGAVTRRELRIERDADAVAYAAAHAFWQLADTVLRERPEFRVALAGGHTPAGMYHELVRQRPTGEVWRGLQFFFGDERAVGPEHPDSNYRMAKAAIFDHAPLAASQIHRMPGEVRPLELAARQYEQTLGGSGLDLVLLGIGADGHTASLFPDSVALQEQSRWVLPVIAPPGNAVRERLTITLPCMAAAREAWFLVTGTQKAGVVATAQETTDDPSLPATLVHATRVVWFVDRAAAAAIASP